MALIVQKFGGTSVGSVERILNVAKKVKTYVDQGHQIVVVVSAMSGETNRLVSLAKAIQTYPNPREMDQILSTGEQVTIGLTAMALEHEGIKALSMTGQQAGIETDMSFTKARIEHINAQKLLDKVNEGYVVVVAGFQGINGRGDITTLGRGGSDTTAVALAAALKADECQIYTDVDGVYTTDPRVEPKARRMDAVTYEEMLELAGLGAKVLQIRSVEFAAKYKINLRVLSSMQEGGGTLITTEDQIVEKPLIAGIAFNKDEAKIQVEGVPDRPGVAYEILGPVADANINIDMIIQNQGKNNTTDFTFTVPRSDLHLALKVLESIKEKMQIASISTDERIAKVSIVGVGMRSHAGVASKMFKTLAENNINIQMISTSEIKVSVVINESCMETAVQALHHAFELDKPLAN